MLAAYVFSSGHFRDLLSSKKDKDGHSRGEPRKECIICCRKMRAAHFSTTYNT